MYACLFFPFLDNELHDHLLKDNKCKSINKSGQCGSGIFSYKEFGKLQSKVNSLVVHRGHILHRKLENELLLGTKRLWG